MANIVSYMENDQRTFSESPLNPVDSLVLSTLAYFNYEATGLVGSPSSNRVLLHDIVALSDWKVLCCSNWLEDAKEAPRFLRALMASRRYRSTLVAFYVNESSDAVEKQFSAVTLFLPDSAGGSEETAYLAFRGTDGSFAGWKEDFNLCFKDVIPSQQAAAAYVSGVASACTCPLVLGGHSKGGNLAEYAASVVDESIYSRIAGIYNHDGPSFLGDPSPRMGQPCFSQLLHKTVPESSAFGMILERREDYRVVQSTALSVFQHEPFSWKVEGPDFLYQESLNPSAAFFDSALDTWLRRRTTAERERFIDTIYELFVSTEANTWGEFQEKLFANMRTLLGTGSKLDPETKRFVGQTLGSLAGVVRDETVRRLRPSPRAFLARRRNAYKSCEPDQSTPPGDIIQTAIEDDTRKEASDHGQSRN